MNFILPVGISFKEFPLVNYSNPDDTYALSQTISLGAQICTADIHSTTYFEEVVYYPVLLCAIGIVSLLLVDIALCCGCTKWCSKDREGSKKSVTFPLVALYIMIIICFLSTNVLYLGYTSLSASVPKITSSIKFVEDKTVELSVIGVQLLANTNNMVQICSQSTNFTCDSSINNLITETNNELNAYLVNVVNAPNYATKYK